MLDIGWTELLIAALVAILIIKPKDLPQFMRTVGGYVGKVRRMARDFQRQVNDAVRDEELDRLRKQLADTTRETEADIRRGLDVAPDRYVPQRRAVVGAPAGGPEMTPLAPSEGNAAAAPAQETPPKGAAAATGAET